MPASPEPAKCFDCNLRLFRCNPDHLGAGQMKEAIQAFPPGFRVVVGKSGWFGESG